MADPTFDVMVNTIRPLTVRHAKRNVSLFPAQILADHWNHADTQAALAARVPGGRAAAPARTYTAVLNRIIALAPQEEHWSLAGRQAVESFVTRALHARAIADLPAPILPADRVNEIFLHFKQNYGAVYDPGAHGEVPITRAQYRAWIDRRNNRTPNTTDPANPKVVRRHENIAACWAMLNAAIAEAREHFDNPYLNVQQGQDFYDQLVFVMADTGTKSDGELLTAARVYYRISVPGGRAHVHDTPFATLWAAVRDISHVRRFGRANCIAAANIGRDRNHQYAPGQSHGMPPELGWLGFDFADVYPATDPRTKIAINQARDAGLFKETGGQRLVTNTSTRFQREGQNVFGNALAGRQA